MKKFACALLALVTAFSLCACDDSDDDDRDRSSKKKNNTKETTEVTVPVEEPTDNEAQMLEEYICAVCQFKEYLSNLPQYPSTYELNMIQDYCRKIQELGYVAKWAKTDRAADLLANHSGYDIPFDTNADWDAEAVLAQFAVVTDVPLYRTYMTTDNLGNKTEPYKDVTWHYDGNGNATQVSEEDKILFSLPHCIDNVIFADGVREYDEAGRLTKITTYSGDTIERVCTYTYNNKDQLVNLTIRENTQTYEISDFQYDEQGRLTRIEWTFAPRNVPHALIYTYNADNTVAMVENVYYVVNDNNERFVKGREAMEYTYENGVAVSGNYVNQTYGEWINFSVGVTSTWVSYETVDTYNFSYDDAGRLVEEVVTHHGRKTYNAEGTLTNETVPDNATTTYTTVYGDYYAQQAK